MLNSHIRQYICKNTKNIQKSDFMDGFCLQSELDLTLFYKIEGYFDNLKSLMTGFMNIYLQYHLGCHLECHNIISLYLTLYLILNLTFIILHFF